MNRLYRGHSACIALATWLALGGLAQAGADTDLQEPPAVVRVLAGSQQREARRMRDHADRLRAAYERAHRPRSTAPEAEAAFRQAEAAFLEVMKLVEDTDLEEYCVQRFSGLYKYHGEPEKGRTLVEQFTRKRAAQRAEREKKLAAIPAGVDRLVKLLSKHWTEKVTPEEIRQAASTLADPADHTVDLLTEHFYHPDKRLAFRHRAVTALEAIGGPKARQVLLDVALRRGETFDLKPYATKAARAYVASAADKSDARKLLVTQDESVLWVALDGLRGQPVDDLLLEKLGSALRSDEMSLRMIAARVLAEDPSPDRAEAKVELLLESLRTVPKMTDIDKTWWPGYLTLAEGLYYHFIDNLAKMPGADEPLRQAMSRATGIEQACLVLARALRGDQGDREVDDALRKLLTDPGAGILRARAAYILEETGKPQDLVVLRRVAESDPLQRKRGGCMMPQAEELFFPVREACRQAVKAIESRAAAQPDS